LFLGEDEGVVGEDSRREIMEKIANFPSTSLINCGIHTHLQIA
jgi:hypothetical protein